MVDLPPPPPPTSFPPPAPPGYGSPAAPTPNPFGPAPYGASTYDAPTYGPAPSDLASFGQRLVAHLIDWLTLSITILVTAIACILVIALGPSHTSTCDTYYYSDELGEQTSTEPCTIPDAETFALVAVIGLAGVAATVVVYVMYFRREGRTGDTWGRKAMGIRLLDIRTGSPIGGGRSFGRFLLASYVSSAICYLGFLWMLWDDRNQTWHDKIMNTVVVRA